MRLVFALMLCPLLAASAAAQNLDAPLDTQLRQAQAEQAAAEAQAARLEQAASKARDEAGRLHAEQAAAAQGIEAAEARISAANARLRLADAYVALHRQQLAEQQQPVSSLLAGLASMARRPPLLVLASTGGTDELVKVRLLLDATLPVIRARTGHLSAELAEGERLQQSSRSARAELAKSRDNLVQRRQAFAALEQQSLQRAVASTGQALDSSDVVLSAGEDIERVRAEQAGAQSIRRVAEVLAGAEPAPVSPFNPDGAAGPPPLAYALPLAAPVTEGVDSVDASGVRSRGLVFATGRGAAVAAPADGVVKFVGPFRDYDGVIIIDHGGGWLSLLVNVGSPLKAGDRVRRGDAIGRTLGPLQVELSQNGRRISPAIIAGSSLSLSNNSNGG